MNLSYQCPDRNQTLSIGDAWQYLQGRAYSSIRGANESTDTFGLLSEGLGGGTIVCATEGKTLARLCERHHECTTISARR
jgi:hypothetical protein